MPRRSRYLVTFARLEGALTSYDPGRRLKNRSTLAVLVFLEVGRGGRWLTADWDHRAPEPKRLKTSSQLIHRSVNLGAARQKQLIIYQVGLTDDRAARMTAPYSSPYRTLAGFTFGKHHLD